MVNTETEIVQDFIKGQTKRLKKTKHNFVQMAHIFFFFQIIFNILKNKFHYMKTEVVVAKS